MAAHQPDIRCAARLLAGPGAHFTARLREGTATSGRSAGRFATQTSNRTRRAVQRTVPFALLVSALVVIWYARHGHRPGLITARRAAQPWYTAKHEPAFEDMLTQLRRTLITARISAGSPAQPTPEQTRAVLAAWHAAAA
jgi:hypothetical protein